MASTVESRGGWSVRVLPTERACQHSACQHLSASYSSQALRGPSCSLYQLSKMRYGLRVLIEMGKPFCPRRRCVWHAPPRPRGSVAPANQRGCGCGCGCGCACACACACGGAGCCCGGGGWSGGGRCTVAGCDLAHDLRRHLHLEAISLRGVAAEGPRAEREVNQRPAEPASGNTAVVLAEPASPLSREPQAACRATSGLPSHKRPAEPQAACRATSGLSSHKRPAEPQAACRATSGLPSHKRPPSACAEKGATLDRPRLTVGGPRLAAAPSVLDHA
jgi:hypothetical protein